MLLTLTTTREPATDLGYLLVKHPDRVHRVEVPSGTATVCFPEAGPRRCTAALILDVDVRSPQRNGSRNGTRNGNGSGDGFALARYVNDRPYAASSLLASALNRVFRSAMRGSNRDRPELAATPIPLEVRIPVLRCRGGAGVLDRLFAPLGWTVQAAPIPLDDEHPEWGASRYLDVTVSATLRLADALNHLYILLPVLDDAKHYWVGPDEIDKLLRAGEGWLATHPSRELIADRYLVHRRGLAADAIRAIDSAAAQRLAEVDDVAVPDTVDANLEDAVDEDADLPSGANAAPLAHQRRDAVLAALAETGSARILDLGCGTGALLQHLVTVKAYTEIVGTDVSTRALEVAERRLRLNQRPGRVRLLQSALTYTDDRLVGFDAAVLMEVIEHIDPPRLPAVVASVFGHARPSTVVVTTPNVEHNVRYPGSPRRRAR